MLASTRQNLCFVIGTFYERSRALALLIINTSLLFATLQPALHLPSKLKNLKYDSADGLKYMYKSKIFIVNNEMFS